jgi:hypothetical protein
VPADPSFSLRDSTTLWEGGNEKTSKPGFIVEGSQLEGQIRITNSTIQPGAPNEGSYGLEVDNQGNQINTEQTYLQQFTANTTSGFDVAVFEDYPEGTNFPTGPSLPIKDPLARFMDMIS